MAKAASSLWKNSYTVEKVGGARLPFCGNMGEFKGRLGENPGSLGSLARGQRLRVCVLGWGKWLCEDVGGTEMATVGVQRAMRLHEYMGG